MVGASPRAPDGAATECSLVIDVVSHEALDVPALEATADGHADVTLEDRVGREAAERLLASHRDRRGLLGWWLRRGARSPLLLELVRLRVALCAPTSSSSPQERWYVVERVLGHGWAVALPSGGVTLPPSAAASVAGAVLPARLDLDACAGRLEALAMRRALVLGRGRPSTLDDLGPARAATYPLWLGYRRVRDGRLRFDAVDAVTGARAGSALRAALAAALVAADAAGRVPTSQRQA